MGLDSQWKISGLNCQSGLIALQNAPRLQNLDDSISGAGENFPGPEIQGEKKRTKFSNLKINMNTSYYLCFLYVIAGLKMSEISLDFRLPSCYFFSLGNFYEAPQ